ncbi:TetR/AcrR family transcriptional regulator [Pseudoclavibacter sp. CFCC 13796]|uniref:TetR/AcrR family transcriptional regulator n=1 Tax=Pseudoclavibacter sp. CFCC 13796 TaxID=2615179 RepID=UPI001787C07A|nr:TetR/AcrR family transcriptional regulator [Pseudoclavibacter sp. CFCC 13796]
MRKKRTGGRPRDTQLGTAIDEALVALVLKQGVYETTIAEIAEEAGTTRQAFYRRYPDIDHALLAALARRFPPAPAPDTGELFSDLVALQEEEIAMLNDPFFHAAFPRLMMLAVNQTTSEDGLGGDVVDPRRVRVQQVIDRARERGEVGDDIDVSVICDHLLGALLPTAFMNGGRRLTGDDARRSAVAALAAARA